MAPSISFPHSLQNGMAYTNMMDEWMGIKCCSKAIAHESLSDSISYTVKQRVSP